MAVSEVLSQAIRSRAHGRCQYCLMHESLQGATFHVEHVIPQSKGGESTLENLALACPSCNLHKTDRTTAVDPLTGEQVPLFHPVRTTCAGSEFAKSKKPSGYIPNSGDHDLGAVNSKVF
jgi:hypothetical protein